MPCLATAQLQGSKTLNARIRHPPPATQTTQYKQPMAIKASNQGQQRKTSNPRKAKQQKTQLNYSTVNKYTYYNYRSELWPFNADIAPIFF